MLICGARIVEVVTLDDYKRAFTPNTIMTNFFNAAEAGEIDRQTWLDVAHQHNVPCHIDAAADMPPIENLWKYTGMGYDLVSFSGGKGIRGPQNAGLLLGKKHLTDLAAANNNPNSDAVAAARRGQKIVGMVAAVDWLLEQNDQSSRSQYMHVDIIKQAVKDVPTLAGVHIPGGEWSHQRRRSGRGHRPKQAGTPPAAAVDRTKPCYRHKQPFWHTINKGHYRH
jgi:L-seryl-tRNA(Ser) seleniumtransferase